MYNILIVDDSRTIRAVIKKTLSIADIPTKNVWEAANGLEALEVLHKEWVDIVFADINMPEMNGIELVERMNDEGMIDTIPVVIVSTEGSKQRIEELRNKGVKAYLRKPFAPESLKNIIGELLETNHA
jgi:two-component system chemotaxis response regulator CheY